MSSKSKREKMTITEKRRNKNRGERRGEERRREEREEGGRLEVMYSHH